ERLTTSSGCASTYSATFFSEGRSAGNSPRIRSKQPSGWRWASLELIARGSFLINVYANGFGRIRKLSSPIFARRSLPGGRGDGVVKEGPQPDVRVVGPGGVHPVGEQDGENPPDGVDPEGRAGKAGVTKALGREKIARG